MPFKSSEDSGRFGCPPDFQEIRGRSQPSRSRITCARSGGTASATSYSPRSTTAQKLKHDAMTPRVIWPERLTRRSWVESRRARPPWMAGPGRFGQGVRTPCSPKYLTARRRRTAEWTRHDSRCGSWCVTICAEPLRMIRNSTSGPRHGGRRARRHVKVVARVTRRERLHRRCPSKPGPPKPVADPVLQREENAPVRSGRVWQSQLEIRHGQCQLRVGPVRGFGARCISRRAS